jgi:hypothetical protein
MLTTSRIILEGMKDLEDWIEVIRTAAIGADIWYLINPNSSTPKVLDEPKRPEPSDVHRRKTKDNLQLRFWPSLRTRRSSFGRLTTRMTERNKHLRISVFASSNQSIGTISHTHATAREYTTSKSNSRTKSRQRTRSASRS